MANREFFDYRRSASSTPNGVAPSGAIQTGVFAVTVLLPRTVPSPSGGRLGWAWVQIVSPTPIPAFPLKAYVSTHLKEIPSPALGRERVRERVGKHGSPLPNPLPQAGRGDGLAKMCRYACPEGEGVSLSHANLVLKHHFESHPALDALRGTSARSCKIRALI